MKSPPKKPRVSKLDRLYRDLPAIVQMRDNAGNIVEITAEEFIALCVEDEVKVYKRHRKCTFLPGVNPKYDAEVACRAYHQKTRAVPEPKTDRRLSEETKAKIRASVKKTAAFNARSF